MPRKVLTNETKQVIKIESNSGITTVAYAAGSFGKPKKVPGLSCLTSNLGPI